jgi:hypothetical protein
MVRKRVVKRKKDDGIAGFSVPAGIFLGLGLGFLFGNLVGWMFVGLGSGFVVMMFLKFLLKE